MMVKKVIDEFCPLFTPGGQIMYVSDTQRNWAYFDSVSLKKFGIHIEEYGRMPDVVVYHTQKKWLILIEAVPSHGPVNPKRRQELKELFRGSKAGLIYVTAFLDRHTMVKYLDDISWETEVWIAESPTHLIHFNGERFLGPYDD
jgi:hypothetical protein